ncbi:MAG: DUF2785 domain-containing protein [Halanaerobium sp.]|nr:DUF2785 domain-containing protein [Halanaerobium sp.]
MKEAQLKKVLSKVKENDFAVPEEIGVEEITKKMLEYIGSTDPVLRDHLIYVTFYHWILQGKYTDEQLLKLAQAAIDEEHLHYGLGEKGTDSVFTRTFSSLLSAVILYANRERHFLSRVQFDVMKEALFHYLKEENDMRGFVPEKGWAHGIAHAADALEELPHFEYLAEEDLEILLNLARDKMVTNDHVFICLEDERMSNAVVTSFKHENLSEENAFAWLDSFNEIEKGLDWTEDRVAIHNLKLFLKSLYFKTIKEDMLPKSYEEKIKEVILKTR